jgi:hypothetical protein
VGWVEARGIERADGSVYVTTTGSDFNEMTKLNVDEVQTILAEAVICVPNEVECTPGETDEAYKLLPQSGIRGIYESAINTRAVFHQAGSTLYILTLDYSEEEGNYDWQVLKAKMDTSTRTNKLQYVIPKTPEDSAFEADMYIRFEGDNREDAYLELENCVVNDPERISSCEKLQSIARFVKIF